jgi:hypothetical protein
LFSKIGPAEPATSPLPKKLKGDFMLNFPSHRPDTSLIERGKMNGRSFCKLFTSNAMRRAGASAILPISAPQSAIFSRVFDIVGPV